MADEGFRDRLAKQSEDALGKLAQDLLENPLVKGAISRAFGAREKATQAQEAALGALNIPTAADVERLTRRLLAARPSVRVAIASHNLRSLAHAVAVSRALGAPELALLASFPFIVWGSDEIRRWFARRNPGPAAT